MQPTCPNLGTSPDAPALVLQEQLHGTLELVQTLIDSIVESVLVLNKKRQVIATNRALLELLSARREEVLGRHLGEIFGCPFVVEGPTGCGSSRQCVNCNALRAVLECRATGQAVLQEYNAMIDRPIKGAALDLRIKATSANFEGETFTVCTLEDIRPRRRLAEISAIFFHDVLNMVGAIHGHLDLLSPDVAGGERHTDLRRLRWLTDQLADEIEAQRDVMLAERNDLEIQPQVVRTSVLVDDLRRVYMLHPAGAGRAIEPGPLWDGMIVTDVRLVSRVLGNMLRNALEATDAGGTVSLGCAQEGEMIALFVHNPSVIPEDIQEQLFKRRVTTKGCCERGVGTRSMKLLSENYLRGSVSFTSRFAEGTTFTLRVPKLLVAPDELLPAGDAEAVQPDAARSRSCEGGS